MNDITQAVRNLEASYTQWLFGVVGLHLSGRACAVQFRQPYIKDFLGLCSRDGKGGVIIQIAPGLSDDQTLEVFCHELAHAKLHYANLPQHTRHKLPAGTWRLNDRDDFIQETKPRESQADKLAARWLQYANQTANGDSMREKLEALLRW